MSRQLTVLSPHLDDAILSCGGLIHRRAAAGWRVTVLTVFTTDLAGTAPSEFAQRILGYMGLEQDDLAQRLHEDLAGCQRVGAEALHWQYAEAIFRRDPETDAPLYASHAELFGAVRPVEENLTAAIERRLRAEIEADEVLAPLAVGGHVDHQILRRAAADAFGSRLGFYEDFPYSRKQAAIEAVLDDPEAWRSEVTPLDREDKRAKLEAIAAYRSQIRPLFGPRWRMRVQVARNLRRHGGERIWRRSQSATE
jgi:LmbE family N-acetylglucosaminyl deacetylase